MNARPELLNATDEVIDDAVKYVDPMVLRGLLYQLTGDESVAATAVSSVEVYFLEAMTVTDPGDIALLRSKAAEFLKSYRDAGAGELSIGPEERLHRSLNLTAGVDIADADVELWLEQLAIDPFARGLVWQNPPSVERLANFSVAVIGAGMGGLNVAVQLKQAGVPFVVLEKNPSVGGTWHENRYPGARVDSPSRSYSHIFGVDYVWPNPFCPQSENEKYFNWVADNFEVRDRIEFNTEVKSVIWDDQAAVWEIEAVGPQGPRTLRVNVVVSAVGFLSRPNLPQIAGQDTFSGPSVHTARWPSDLDVSDKRVAVIGTGCTGYQLVPELAKLAGHTYIFQRTPNWCFDAQGYLQPFPPQVNWLDRNLPYHTNFMRYRIGFLYGPDILRPRWEIDPGYADPHALSAMNNSIREQRIAFMRSKLADRPDLFDKMLPPMPPMTARPVLIDSDDSIFDALLRDNVTLISDGIRAITANGIVTSDGEQLEVDIIVYATGFKANEFLWPMDVRGRDGQRLEKLWEKDGARAYLGVMLPGFPNFFMVYGPNTNPLCGLQVPDFEEIVTRFALECIRGLFEQNKRTVDVAFDAYQRFNDVLDRWESFKTYRDPRVNNYYRNEYGRSAANSPIDLRLMWGWLRSPIAPRPDLVLYDGSPVAGANPVVNGGLVKGGADEIHPYFGQDLVVE
jgi:4-hydroxyacetophenone monooxygenase